MEAVSATKDPPAEARGWTGAVLRYLSFRRVTGAIPELDGLRALAVLLVVARHATQFKRPGQVLLPLGSWDAVTPLVNGWMGVDLFFVLSGFLITHHLLRHDPAAFTPDQMLTYLYKRVLRIVPTYYGVLLLVVAGVFPLYPSPAMPQPPITWDVVAYHLLFLQDYFPSTIVVAFWSLGVEEKFYLLLPGVLVGLSRLRTPKARAGALLAAVASVPLLRVAAMVGATGNLTDYNTFFRVVRSPFHLNLDALLVGTLCALLYRHRRELPWMEDRRRIIALGAGGGAVALALLCARPWMERIGWFEGTLLTWLLSLGLGALMLSLLLHRSVLAAPLRWKALHVVSSVSFPLYLIHMVFLFSVNHWLHSFRAYMALPDGAAFLVYLGVYGAVSLTAALVLHYVLEKPFLLLKERLSVAPARAA